MKQHAPSLKKLQKANRNGQFLHYFTTRGCLLLLLSCYLVFEGLNLYWVTIQKLLKSSLGNLSLYQIDNILQLACLLTQIFFGAMLVACVSLLLTDLFLRRFQISHRENLCEFNKFNPLSVFKGKLKHFKQEFFKLFLIPLMAIPFIFYLPISWSQAKSYPLNNFYELFGLLTGIVLIACCFELLVRRSVLSHSLMMDDQEMKAESKNDRSDPLTASRQQSEYRLLLLDNMETKVKSSKVIFINKF